MWNFCFCLGDVKVVTKRISNISVISFLTTKVFAAASKLTMSSFIKAMKAEQSIVFHPDNVPNR